MTEREREGENERAGHAMGEARQGSRRQGRDEGGENNVQSLCCRITIALIRWLDHDYLERQKRASRAAFLLFRSGAL